MLVQFTILQICFGLLSMVVGHNESDCLFIYFFVCGKIHYFCEMGELTTLENSMNIINFLNDERERGRGLFHKVISFTTHFTFYIYKIWSFFACQDSNQMLKICQLVPLKNQGSPQLLEKNLALLRTH